MKKGAAQKKTVLPDNRSHPDLNNILKNQTATVHKGLFRFLHKWYVLLVDHIIRNNKGITKRELDSILPRIIGRIIFLRIAESKSLEPYENVKKILHAGGYYSNLLKIFKEADKKYNLGLSESHAETGLSIKIKNNITERFINDLYPPQCPIDFSSFSAEILGRVYEELLEKEITVNVESKTAITQKGTLKKAGGIYYTPPYIVEYIVSNTLGKLIKGKTPEEISTIKIIDPSCGSGNFLVYAYQYLIEYHETYYRKASENKRAKRHNILSPDGNLSFLKKKQILLNNIFGVDLDSAALEITKLTLALKAMEGHTTQSLSEHTKSKIKNLLPSLTENFKQGNSLIAPDFCITQATSELKDEIKPFDWTSEFPDAFAAGGFDVVIGNPPYGAHISKELQKYFLSRFPFGNTDTAALFMALASELLKDKGWIGYIVPKAFTYASNWSHLRSRLLTDLVTIVDCSKVWRNVKLEMSIYLSQHNSNYRKFTSCIRKGEIIKEIGAIEKSLCKEFDLIINGVRSKEINIARKMRSSGVWLNDLVINRRGGMLQKYITGSGWLKVIGGGDIQRYAIRDDEGKYINQNDIADKNSFIKEESILVQNIIAHIQRPYPRIQITASIPDARLKEQAVILDTVNQLTNISSLSSYYILGVLNSKIISWYTYKFIFANAVRTMHFDSITTQKIPFPKIDLTLKRHKTSYDRIVKCVKDIVDLSTKIKIKKVIPDDEGVLSRINCLEEEINKNIAALFSLSKDELAGVQ